MGPTGATVEVLISLALAAVGCSTRVRDLARAGWAPVLLAALVRAAAAAATVAVLLTVGLD